LESIADGLRALGLCASDVVLVHSDLRRLGGPRDLVKPPNCGADLLIDAFLEVLGPTGTLLEEEGMITGKVGHATVHVLDCRLLGRRGLEALERDSFFFVAPRGQLDARKLAPRRT